MYQDRERRQRTNEPPAEKRRGRPASYAIMAAASPVPICSEKKNSKGEMTMFNFGGCGCGDGCNSDLWGCLINLIILFIVLEFLCNIINGNNGLTCGNCC